MNIPDHSTCSRHAFLARLCSLPLFVSPGLPHREAEKSPDLALPQSSAKLSLNAYSFNKQLLERSMTIEDVLNFCAENGLVAVDLTAYYFPGYPNVPADAYLYEVKRMAFRSGVEISGTGVRNDFTEADPRKRQESVRLVKNWIVAAQKIGAQTVRIFSGNQKPEGYSRKQVLAWMLKDIRECIDFGKAHGIVVSLQNHDDFIKTADDIIEVMEAIASEWFGLTLDIGSLQTADPYEEIARTVKYAVTWQVKEKVYIRGKEQDVDAEKLANIIRAAGYHGYLPLETLGPGDPKEKLSALLAKFRTAFAKP